MAQRKGESPTQYRERREKAAKAARERRQKRIDEGKPVLGGGIDRNPNTRGYLFDRKAPKSKLQTKTDIEKGTAKVGAKSKKPNFVEKAMGPKSDVTSADLAKVKPASPATRNPRSASEAGVIGAPAYASQLPAKRSSAKPPGDSPGNPGANRRKRRMGMNDVDVDVDNSAAMDFIGGVDIPGPASKLPGMKKGGKVGGKAKKATKAKRKTVKVRGAGIARKGVRPAKMR